MADLRILIKEMSSCKDCPNHRHHACCGFERCVLPKVKNSENRMMMVEIRTCDQCPYYDHRDETCPDTEAFIIGLKDA